MSSGSETLGRKPEVERRQVFILFIKMALFTEERANFMSKSKSYTIEVGRSSVNGRFITPEQAERRPNTTELEHIRIPRKK